MIRHALLVASAASSMLAPGLARAEAPIRTASTATSALPAIESATSAASVVLSEEWTEIFPQLPRTSTALSDPETVLRERPRRPQAPPRASIRFAFTGASGGIGSGQYNFRFLRTLERGLPKDWTIRSIRAHHGALVQGLHAVIAEDRTAASALAYLQEGEGRCDPPSAVTSLRSTTVRVFSLGGPWPAWIDGADGQLSRRPYLERRCVSPGGRRIRWLSPEDARPIEWSLPRFELRLAVRVELVEAAGRTATLELIGVPLDEAARRFRLLTALIAEHPGTMYLDAGSFVDGPSAVRDGELSLHRPLGFAMLRALAPVALVPGETELLGGADRFLAETRAEGLPYVATNWRAQGALRALPWVVHRTVETSLGELRLAVLGVVDPRVAGRATQLAAEGVEITAPLPAITEAVERLRTGTAPPDLILLLSSAPYDLLREIHEGVDRLNLMIGDAVVASDRLRETVLEIKSGGGRRSRSAVLLPLAGISRAEIEIEQRPRRGKRSLSIRRVRLETFQMEERLDPDPGVLARVTQVRAEVYPALERTLLPAPSGGTYQPEEWRRLVCEAVRRRTGADVALLPEIPPPPRVPGPLTELLVADRLAVLDRLERHSILGARLGDLLHDAGEVVPISCGAPIGVRGPPVLGRGIDPERLYLVVSTDRARLSGLDPLLARAYSMRWLDARGREPILRADGAQMTLRSAVLDQLRRVRDRAEDPAQAFAQLLEPSHQTKSPLLALRLSRVSLRVERFKGAENPAFSQIPETKATSPSSLSLAGDADVALVFDAPAVLGDLRLRLAYSLLSLDGGDELEQADDLRLSTSATLPGIAIPAGPFGLSPYAELLLDSELTPVVAESGELPRQLDLSLTVGVSAGGLAYLPRLRVGAFAQRDLNRDQPIELGGRAEAELGISFGPELRFSTLLDATVFASTPDDDAGDLRFKALIEPRLSLPLSRLFNLAIFAQWFVFQGRIPETEAVESSYLLGVAFEARGSLRLYPDLGLR
jgi:hypothetical protein